MKAPRVQVLDADAACQELELVRGPGSATAIVWPGMGARFRSLHRIVLRRGARTIPLRHAMEAVYYVRSGTATVFDAQTRVTHSAETGSMIFIEPDTGYVISSEDEGAEVLGGPCPPDMALYAHLMRE